MSTTLTSEEAIREIREQPELNSYQDYRNAIRAIVEQVPLTPSLRPKQMQDMTEPELSQHLSRQLRFIKACQTADTIGSMLVVFQNNGITQYGSTLDPETTPQALRELADRIERREAVTR